jgi:hypothetical protein
MKCKICNKYLYDESKDISDYSLIECCSMRWYPSSVLFSRKIHEKYYVCRFYYDNNILSMYDTFRDNLYLNIELDFSNLDKLFNKIEKFIMFS